MCLCVCLHIGYICTKNIFKIILINYGCKSNLCIYGIKLLRLRCNVQLICGKGFHWLDEQYYFQMLQYCTNGYWLEACSLQ